MLFVFIKRRTRDQLILVFPLSLSFSLWQNSKNGLLMWLSAKKKTPRTRQKRKVNKDVAGVKKKISPIKAQQDNENRTEEEEKNQAKKKKKKEKARARYVSSQDSQCTKRKLPPLTEPPLPFHSVHKMKKMTKEIRNHQLPVSLAS